MRKVVVGAMVSLDGVMQAPGGPEEDPTGGFGFGGRVFNYFDEALGQYMDSQFTKPFDLLLGRKTYEILFAAYWPYQDDQIGNAFNKVTKYVATRSDMPLTWTRRAAEGRRRRHRAPEAGGRTGTADPGLDGSATGPASRRPGRPDRLLIFPLVLGKGKRLFENGAAAAGLKLESSQSSPSGAIMATYTPAGAVTPGSFPSPEASEAELARREKMKREG